MSEPQSPYHAQPLAGAAQEEHSFGLKVEEASEYANSQKLSVYCSPSKQTASSLMRD